MKLSALANSLGKVVGTPLLRFHGVFAAMIMIAVVALIAEWPLTMIEDRLLTWRPETTVNE